MEREVIKGIGAGFIENTVLLANGISGFENIYSAPPGFLLPFSNIVSAGCPMNHFNMLNFKINEKCLSLP